MNTAFTCMTEKTAADIYRLAMIKVACYEAGYDFRNMSNEDMEKIAAIQWPKIWGGIKALGNKGIGTAKRLGNGALNYLKGEGGHVIGGVKQIPKVVNVAAKNPRFARGALYRTLAETNFDDVKRNALPNMAIDQFIGGKGNPVDYMDIFRFLNRLGNNMNGFNEYIK